MMKPESKNFEYSLMRKEDRDFAISLWTDSAVMRLIPGGPMGGAAASRRVDSILKQSFDPGLGYWIVREKKTKEPLGYVVLRPFEWDERYQGIEMGYLFAEKNWGKGVATEAAEAIVRFAKEELGQKSLLALADGSNVASNRILERLGFKEETQAADSSGASIWRLDCNSLES